MYEFWKRFREFLVPLGMAGLFVSLLCFGILRILRENQEKMISNQQAIVDWKMLEEQTNEISGMRDEVDRIRSASEKLNVLLSKDSIVSTVELIESVGNDLGVSVFSEASSTKALAALPVKKKATTTTDSASDDVSVAPSAGGKNAVKETLVSLLPEERSVFITFRVTGEYANVLTFLRKLDTMPVLLDVLSLDIEPVPVDEGKASVAPASLSGISASPFAPSAASSQPIATPQKEKQILASFDTVLYTTP